MNRRTFIAALGSTAAWPVAGRVRSNQIKRVALACCRASQRAIQKHKRRSRRSDEHSKAWGGQANVTSGSLIAGALVTLNGCEHLRKNW